MEPQDARLQKNMEKFRASDILTLFSHSGGLKNDLNNDLNDPSLVHAVDCC
jgi:hypothetical protein